MKHHQYIVIVTNWSWINFYAHMLYSFSTLYGADAYKGAC